MKVIRLKTAPLLAVCTLMAVLSFFSSVTSVEDFQSETVFLHAETSIDDGCENQDYEISDSENDSWFGCGLSLSAR